MKHVCLDQEWLADSQLSVCDFKTSLDRNLGSGQPLLRSFNKLQEGLSSFLSLPHLPPAISLCYVQARNALHLSLCPHKLDFIETDIPLSQTAKLVW